MEQPVFWLIFGASLGLIWGSFLHVVYARTPMMLKNWKTRKQMTVWWSYPESCCPFCNHRLSWIENFPIVGWLRLKGQCSSCKAPIPVRYLLWEIICGSLGALLGYYLHFIFVFLLVFLLLMLAIIEIIWRLLNKKRLYAEGK